MGLHMHIHMKQLYMYIWIKYTSTAIQLHMYMNMYVSIQMCVVVGSGIVTRHSHGVAPRLKGWKPATTHKDMSAYVHISTVYIYRNICIYICIYMHMHEHVTSNNLAVEWEIAIPGLAQPGQA